MRMREAYEDRLWDVHCENSELRLENDELKAENAKLWELVRDYHTYEHGDCLSCRYHDECRDDDSGRCIAPMLLAERVREMGILKKGGAE